MAEYICKETNITRQDGAVTGRRMEKIKEIVRCKDCKYRGDTEKCVVAYAAMKQNIEVFMLDNHGEWFCADGKRRRG